MSGHCQAGDTCRWWDRDARAPAWTEGQLCHGCMIATRRDTRALVRDYADLAQLLPRKGAAGERISGSRETQTPLTLDVEAQQRAIHDLVTGWARILRQVEHLAPAPARGVRPGWAVQHSVETIDRFWGRLAGLPAMVVTPAGPDGPLEQTGAQAILAMSAMHRWAMAALGLTRLIYELPGECPECHKELFRRENGTETVYCAGCPASMTWDAYQEYAVSTVAWLPSAEVARIVGVSSATVRQWRTRGQLRGLRTSQGWHYRVPDVRKLAFPPAREKPGGRRLAGACMMRVAGERGGPRFAVRACRASCCRARLGL